MGKEPEYLTPAEASKLSGLTDSALRARSIRGKLRVIKTVGGHRRYLRADVEAQVLPANGRRKDERERRGRGSRKRKRGDK